MRVDLKNEPHGAATWGTGNPATDWNKAVERAAAAVGRVAPRWLIFVEGIQENASCSANNHPFWGENLEPLSCTPLSIPGDRLVLSPHTYGPDVFGQPYFNDPTFPHNMAAMGGTKQTN
jgi:endoglucanase